MKVCVTGSGGYIGRHVVTSLLEMGHEVIAADINNDQVDERATRVETSIFSLEENAYTELGSPDVCIHLAWRNGFVHNAPTHMEDLSAHCRFLRYMMEGGLKRLAIMGSMHEVGYWEGAIDENTPCSPLSQYGIAKNALRQSALKMADVYGTKLYWLRAYYIIGDDMKNHSVFTKLLEMGQKGERKFPFTSGKNKFDFIEVDELAHMIAMASTQDAVTGIINVCTGQPMSLGDKAEAFIKEHNLSIELDYGAFPDREYDSPGIWGDATKIKEIEKRYKERAKS